MNNRIIEGYLKGEKEKLLTFTEQSPAFLLIAMFITQDGACLVTSLFLQSD